VKQSTLDFVFSPKPQSKKHQFTNPVKPTDQVQGSRSKGAHASPAQDSVQKLKLTANAASLAFKSSPSQLLSIQSTTTVATQPVPAIQRSSGQSVLPMELKGAPQTFQPTSVTALSIPSPLPTQTISSPITTAIPVQGRPSLLALYQAQRAQWKFEGEHVEQLTEGMASLSIANDGNSQNGPSSILEQEVDMDRLPKPMNQTVECDCQANHGYKGLEDSRWAKILPGNNGSYPRALLSSARRFTVAALISRHSNDNCPYLLKLAEQFPQAFGFNLATFHGSWSVPDNAAVPDPASPNMVGTPQLTPSESAASTAAPNSSGLNEEDEEAKSPETSTSDKRKKGLSESRWAN
jgi:hypothetical protein